MNAFISPRPRSEYPRSPQQAGQAMHGPYQPEARSI